MTSNEIFTMDDHELISAVINNDREAFNDLVLKYRDRVFHHAYYLLQNYETAEDITQEVFLKSFQKLHLFRGGSFLAWLLKITKNLCYDEFRTWKRTSLISLEPLNNEGDPFETSRRTENNNRQAEESVESNELREELEYGLFGLPAYYQTAVNLVDFQDFSYKEAATSLGISIGTLKSRLERGRKQLRKIYSTRDAAILSEKIFFNLSA